MSDAKKSFLAAAAAILIWGTLASTVKLLVGGMSNLQTLAISSWVAALLFFAVNMTKKNRRQMLAYGPREYGDMVILGFLGMFAYNAFYFYGLTQLSAQEACILNYLWPVALIVFSCLILKEHFTGRKALAVTLSFAGRNCTNSDELPSSLGNTPRQMSFPSPLPTGLCICQSSSRSSSAL